MSWLDYRSKNYTRRNKILPKGVLSVNSLTGAFKIGDGKTLWGDLPEFPLTSDGESGSGGVWLDPVVLSTEEVDWSDFLDGGTWSFVDGVISQTDPEAWGGIELLEHYPSVGWILQGEFKIGPLRVSGSSQFEAWVGCLDGVEESGTGFIIGLDNVSGLEDPLYKFQGNSELLNSGVAGTEMLPDVWYSFSIVLDSGAAYFKVANQDPFSVSGLPGDAGRRERVQLYMTGEASARNLTLRTKDLSIVS